MIKINIKIDGYEISIPEGIPLINAARESGFYIPGICSHPDLKPSGVCGLCVVEIDGFDEPQLSCMIMPTDGMVIRTSSERLTEIRENALKEILADHPHACLDCDIRFECDRTQCKYDKPGYDRCCGHFDECELRHLTDYMGVPKGTPEYKPRDLPKITEQEMFFRDYNLCVSCTRCVQACVISEGLNIYGDYFPDGKLDQSKIKPLTETDCSFCGYCVDACPTGAISLLETDFGFLGYFPMGTAGRLAIPTPPPSEKLPLNEEAISQVTVNPGRFNIYHKDGKLLDSRRCKNLQEELSEHLHEFTNCYFTLQPYY